jgi:LysW-gamma-L-lysine carboxypeptidase
MLEELMLELLKAYSPSGNEAEAIKRYVDVVSRWWNGDIVVDDAGNALLNYGRGEKWVLLAGHIDTVPGELPVEYDGTIFRGRGAVDAKGPLVSMTIGSIEAIKHLNEEVCRITIAALVDEERGSSGAKRLMRDARPTAIIVGEPSNFNIIIGYRGSMKLEIKCHGSGGHSSTPQSGTSAIDKLIESLLEVKKRVLSVPGSSIVVNYIEGGLPFSLIPKEARALVDIRIPLGWSTEAFGEIVKSCMSDCTYNIVDETPPVRVRVDTPIARSLARSMIRNGLKPSPVIKLGTSDMNLLIRITENIVGFGPGRSELSHTDREEISIAELELGARIYRDTVREFLS